MGKFPKFLLFSLAFSLFFLLFSKISFAETVYPYWIEPDTLDVWTKVSIPANGQVTLYIQKVSGYYPTSADDIFIFYDDFSTSTKWSLYQCSISNGIMSCSEGGCDVSAETTKQIPMYDVRIISKIKISSSFTDPSNENPGFDVGFDSTSGSDTDVPVSGNWYLLTFGNYKYSDIGWRVWKHSGTSYSNIYSADNTKEPSLDVFHTIEYKIFSSGQIDYYLDGDLLDSYTISSSNLLTDDGGYLAIREFVGEIDYLYVANIVNPEPSITIYDLGDYYKVEIKNNVAQDLTDYQIKLDGSQLGISSTSESLKISDTEPTSENLPPTIEISSPQNQTYYTTSLNLKFKVTDDNSTTFWVKAYFNDSLIYNNTNYQNNTEITIDLQPYLLDWMKTISVKVWANDTDQDNPQISEKTVYFTLDLYDFNFTISNYTTFNNSKYAENLIYSYSARCGYLDHNATIKIYANNSEIYSREFVCGNSTITYQTTYRHSNEGLVNLTAKLLNYAGEIKANQTYEYYNDLNPPIVDVSTTLHIGFYINYPQENGTYNVTDTISPYVLCSYYFGNTNGTDNITRANYSKPYTYLYNLVHGNNTLKVNCSDILNHSTEHTLIQKVYLFHIKPIDEETGIYDEALWTDTATGNSSQFRFTSFDKNMNESFIFENISEDVYLVLTPTKSWILRFEQEYTDQIISDIYDLDYSPPTLYVCVAADKPTVFQTAYSSVPIEDKAFAVTRSDTGCVKTISETGLIENGYGFNFYTMSGHYALWYIENPFAWDQKTLLASFSGDAQITLDLEKALLLAQKIQEISIPSFNLLYISQYNGENATLIRYLSPETIKYFQINLTKEGEDEPFYTQTLSEATAIRILLYWNNFNLKSNDIIHIDYIAEFPDGRIDKGSLRTTPTGREIWFTWWEAAIIMFMPTVILFMRELDWKNIFVFSLIYVVCALIILPHSELNTVTQAFGLLGIVALFTAAIIIIKKV